MLDREKVEAFLNESLPEDESSELHRFLQDFLIRIEFGNFDPEEDEEC